MPKVMLLAPDGADDRRALPQAALMHLCGRPPAPGSLAGRSAPALRDGVSWLGPGQRALVQAAPHAV